MSKLVEQINSMPRWEDILDAPGTIGDHIDNLIRHYKQIKQWAEEAKEVKGVFTHTGDFYKAIEDLRPFNNSVTIKRTYALQFAEMENISLEDWIARLCHKYYLECKPEKEHFTTGLTFSHPFWETMSSAVVSGGRTIYYSTKLASCLNDLRTYPYNSLAADNCTVTITITEAEKMAGATVMENDYVMAWTVWIEFICTCFAVKWKLDRATSKIAFTKAENFLFNSRNVIK